MKEATFAQRYSALFDRAGKVKIYRNAFPWLRDRRLPYPFLRASRSTVPVHSKKRTSSTRHCHINANMLMAVSVSAFMPENVSTLQRRYGLRHGVNR